MLFRKDKIKYAISQLKKEKSSKISNCKKVYRRELNTEKKKKSFMPVTWMWWHTGHEGAVWEDRKENATFHCSCTIPQTLGPIRIMLNLLCWCSLTEINRTTKPKRCYICLQHGLINIWSPLLKRTAQKKNCCFSVAQVCLTLRPHGLQHIRLPCPSPIPGVCSN